MVSAESESLLDQKRALRGAMNEQRARLAAAERARAATAAALRLVDLPEVRSAARRGAIVSGFVATRAEIDPAGALDNLRQQGGRVALPRVGDGSPRLRFHIAAAGDLRPGRFGISEPDPACPAVGVGEVAVMIVPGLAFDGSGHRLGFGGGYYDEVLVGPGTARPPFVVGLGYDFQVVDACPAGDLDARVDCIVTEARVIRCRDRKVGA